jgi:hypothetical protein
VISQGSPGSLGVSGPAAPVEASWELPQKVTMSVKEALAGYVGGQGPDVEDTLFSAHTAFVDRSLKMNQNLGDPPRIWATDIEPLVRLAEARIKTAIHKGAPFYNSALCLFQLGDFDGALSYFASAAEEDAIHRHEPPERLFTGNHPLSPQVLIAPLERDLFPHFSANYLEITGVALDGAELKNLLGWFAVRITDALQLLSSLHSISRSLRRDDDVTSRHSRSKAIGDIAVAVESTMKIHWAGSDVFHARLESALSANRPSCVAFDSLHRWFCATFTKTARESAVAVNAVLTEAQARFRSASTRAERVGIAAYATLRFRNSAEHVNDEQLDTFQDRATALIVAGWALSTCRTVQHAHEGTLSAL